MRIRVQPFWRIGLRWRATAVVAACAFAVAAISATEETAAGAAVSSEPALSVTFVHPEAFTDAVIATPAGPDPMHLEAQNGILDHLAKLAAKGLPAGESLDIRFLDIDLAGRAHPPRAGVGSDFRVMREEDWPRLKFRYTLKRGDQVLASREVALTDQDYLHRANRYPTGDTLRFEKSMLDEWFAALMASTH